MVGCPAGSAATCFRDNYSMFPLQVQFFRNALSGEDQLRQRVALALHEILVVSGVEIRQPSEMSPYLNMLQKDAFANYRQILDDLTLNPAMGRYLDMVNNDAPAPGSDVAPNENYAREVLQLFSTGVNQLRPDGTVVLDGNGDPVPAYSQDTVEDLAHVLTGWTYAPLAGARLARHDPPNFLAPMVLYRDGAGKDTNHDKGVKLLLSYPGSVFSTIPANQDGETDLRQALDNIFHHPNVGPFIGKQLIQHLVTSNPSPAYVARVAAAFDDDGSGVRGDMRAVIRAILLDPEARGSTKTDPAYGHLREPVLFITGLLRALGASVPVQNNLAGFARNMNQNVYYPPTVFNYFAPSYEIPDAGVSGPEFQLLSPSNAMARVNFLNRLFFGTLGDGTTLDLSPFTAAAPDPQQLVDLVDATLFHGSMSAQVTESISKALSATKDNPTRAKTALYLAASSGQYQVEQ
jgi:uncharacterized protein (DUF1800 family)